MASPFSPAAYCFDLSPPPREHHKEDKAQKPQQAPATPPPPATVSTPPYVHNPTPLHPSFAATASSVHALPTATTRRSSRPRAQPEVAPVSVSCDKCRPTSRDKLVYVVPLDGAGAGGRRRHTPAASVIPSSPIPAGLRSLFLSLTRRSPASAPASSSAAAAAAAAAREDQWRLVAAELSRKLVLATRKRDEALHEASRLKYSLADLEGKLDRLESRCRDLRTALQPTPAPPGAAAPFPVEDFRFAVADAGLAVRRLARSLIAQIRQGPPGSGSADRITALIQPYDARAAAQWRRNPGGLLYHVEALLNRALYAGFEEDDEEEAVLVDPADRCESSRLGLEAVRDLGWDEVLLKGTRHYSEALSRFCDRKMSEVVAMVGWTRAWPEPLLQAFFGAVKGAWVVRLMARSVHPAVPVLRVNRGAAFDGRFMEDVASRRVPCPTPSSVRMMVAPGFHVYTDCGGGVVKCKVLCVYDYGGSGSGSGSNCGNSECSNDAGYAGIDR